MAGLLQGILRVGLLLVAVISGCPIPVVVGMYGMPTPTEPPDPDLRLIDLSYEPASPVADGAELTFTITANKAPLSPIGIDLIIGENNALLDPALRTQLMLYMRDTGIEPDMTANDGVFTGLLKLPSQAGPLDSLSVVAHVYWYSPATPPVIQGELLSILAAEEE